MRKHDPKVTNVFDSICDSFTTDQREDLLAMLDRGLTPEAATQLLDDGLTEEGNTGSKAVPELPVLFTRSAKNDLDCFVTERNRQRLNIILASLRTAIADGKCQTLLGGQGLLLRDGPFRVVFKRGKDEASDVVFAIAGVGNNPTKSVWRYFDQLKAEDLLKTGCLYFCRLDQLTGDPREARLPLFAKRVRTNAFRSEFGDDAPKAVNEDEEILRGTTYVCCWTRREHESYLAWRHYCPSGGGFAINSTLRRIDHVHLSLRAKDDLILCRDVGYLDPLTDDLPDHSYGEEVFWKSNWFSDETEIRIAAFRPLSGNSEKILEGIKRTLPRGEWIPCDLNVLVHEIVINPFATEDQQWKLKEILARFRPELANRVRESAILAAERH